MKLRPTQPDWPLPVAHFNLSAALLPHAVPYGLSSYCLLPVPHYLFPLSLKIKSHERSKTNFVSRRQSKRC